MELTLVGTGHVFAIGDVVGRIIAERRPDIVCVELDATRLRGLEERRRIAAMEAAGDPRVAEIRRQQAEATKRLPLVYRLLARLQERLATQQGVEAGGEMLAAVDAARAQALPVACIDVDAQQLIRRAWGQMGIGERLRFLFAMWRGQTGGTVESEMEQYQKDPVAYLGEVGDRFPTLKRVLIDERDEHMARAILGLHDQRGRLPGAPDPVRVVAVVGDGHVAGILRHLGAEVAGHPVEVVRVQALREGHVPPSPFATRAAAATGDTSTVHLSFTVGPAQSLPTE